MGRELIQDSRSRAREALRIERLSKTFPGTRALQNVSFGVEQGTIHALLGGNGSGKSTLIKILAGVYQGDPGGVFAVSGTEVASDRTTPAHAKALGLRFVHQNPAVFPALSVAENIAIGARFQTRAGAIRWSALRRRTQVLLDRFEIDVRPTVTMSTVRPATRAMIAIARALQDQEGDATGVLVLDEPTASLPRTEVEVLLAALARYAAHGQTILLVSHRLDEVIESATRATVLRDGQLAGTLERSDITGPNLIRLIAGRNIRQVFPEMPAVTSQDVVLSLRNLAGGPLRGVNVDLVRGEVLGIAGLLGSGRSELLKIVFGAGGTGGGVIELDGHPVTFRDIGKAMAAGVAYVPEDRPREASFPEMSVSENLSAAVVSSYWKRFRLQHGAADHDARRSITDFLVRASSDQQTMSTLSGGNQQKVILARWLRRSPKILLLDEPTQGVDINARAEIYALIRDAVARGCSVLLVTSDFEELSRVCDRAVVLANGRITGEFRSPDMTPAQLTEAVFAIQETAA